MKIKDFESSILAMELKPMDVRLEHGHVKWFICQGSGDYEVVVFDSEGRALVLQRFDWPEDDGSVYVEHYHDERGMVLGVTINGKPMQRDNRLDLKFERA